MKITCKINFPYYGDIFKKESSLTIEDERKFNKQETLVTLVIPYKILDANKIVI